MKDISHKNLSEEEKRKDRRNLVFCYKHGVSAAGGTKCLRCCKEAAKARREEEEV